MRFRRALDRGNVTEALSAASELPHVRLTEQAILAALVVMAGERKRNAAFALADLLSRRGLKRPCESLVAWTRSA